MPTNLGIVLSNRMNCLRNVVRVALFAIDTSETERSEPYGKCCIFLPGRIINATDNGSSNYIK